ncbi:Uncharacterized protein At1g65710 [Linum grandiflorum]
MGTCFSKKNISSSSPAPATKEAAPARRKEEEDSISNTKKKEIFVIKHTNSYRERHHQQPAGGLESGEGVTVVTRVRGSSCSKEEVDAILIQCGRLSRSSSLGKKSAAARRRRSGSKTSFDFDEQLRREEEEGDLGGDEASAAGRESRRRQNHHRRCDSQSSRNSSPAGTRRRTPSRERDGGRRVSLSPGRRSGNLTAAGNCNPAATNVTNRPPGKMVSVPPTVSSSAAPQAGIRRISVQRNVGGASPRSQSPSGNQQQPSPRRSLTRKAENSPYRRNPLAEINSNSLAYPPANGEKISKNNLNVQVTGKESIQKPHPFQQKASMAATEETINPSRTRSRSARRSRDMDDINPPEGLLNHHPQPTTYTSMLLQDINNFHHKSNTINIRNNNDSNKSNAVVPSSFELPDCLKKACSILEAVADLNSTPIRVPMARQQQQQQQHQQFSDEVNKVDSFPPLESMDDEVMEPSFDSYVTVRRGSGGVSCSGEEDIGMLQERGRNSRNAADSEKSSRCNVVPLGLGIGDRVHGLSERAGGIGDGIGGRMEEKGFNGGRRNGIGRSTTSIASSSST